MQIKTLAVGPIAANCYIVGCEKTQKAAVIDPGDEGPRLLATIAEMGLTVTHIFNTHGHFDHVGANKAMKDATGAPIYICEDDNYLLEDMMARAAAFGLRVEKSPPADHFMKDGEAIAVGDLVFRVIHTPGHSPGGVCLHCDKVLFVGDTLFAGSIGRTDFPRGDFNTLKNSIQQKLYCLDDTVTVYPGHGPRTTIGAECRSNPFVSGRG